MDKAIKSIPKEMLSKVIESSPIPSFVIDTNHKIILWNTAIEVLSGIKSKDIIRTDNHWKAFYVQKRPTLADLIIDGAPLDRIEFYFGGRYKKSHLIVGAYEAQDFFLTLGQHGSWLHFTASPIKNKEGEIIGAVETLQDITERKKAEEMLTKIIDGSTIPSFVINVQHQVTHWNIAIEALTGIKKNEILGTSDQWRTFYREKRPSLADLIVDRASKEKIEAYYQGKCKPSNLILGAYEAEDFFSEVLENGKWLHFTASPVKDKNGEIVGAIETLEDISERKKTEQALYESEKSFRDLFESALDAIWVHDLEGNILIANKAASILFSCPSEKLCQVNISAFLAPESHIATKVIQTKLSQHQPVVMPYQQRLILKNGSELIVELTTRLIESQKQNTAFQNIARDVTKERKLQESMRFYLQKVLVAQEEERKRVARELHDETAQSLLLLIHRLDSQISDHKTIMSKPVREELSKLNDLAKDILQGIRRYAQELRPAILDDLGLASALEWMADQLAKEKGIQVDVQISTEINELPGEAQLVLFRIVQEAISNIRKYAEASKVAIKLESREGKKSLIITDNGKGFSVPLRVTDLSNMGKFGIIGMKERAELLNGIMTVQSEPGKGTSIIIEISAGK
jgi:PAS domain S-box-containing protein